MVAPAEAGAQVRSRRIMSTWIPACAGMTHLFPIAGRSATRSRTNTSFRLLRADLLIPDAERFDLRLRLQGLRMRELGEPLVVLRPPELLDRILAFLRRHPQRDVLHRRAGIEIALVVRV